MEETWVERSRAGDHRAFRRLYELHVSGLYRFLAQFSDDPDDTAEWVQRAFIRSFERLDQFDGRSAFGTWLFRIGLNEMRADLRRKKIVPFEPEAAAAEVVMREDVDAFEWSSSLRSALDGLDDTRRTVFILYEVEGFSHSEIATMLSIEESHSRTILTRAKAALRDRLMRERRA